MLPLLKWHIAKMLPRTEVVDLRMLNKLLGKMVRLVSGSRFAMSEMVVLLVGSAGAGLRDLLGSLLEGRRGVVLIGDCHVLCKDPVWASFLAWCKSNKLLMSCQGALSDRTVV